ncbi:MAG: O-antigen ligase family protein [Polaromonas sp.]|uniref:O-antigen ligase family protein n=1 Tax=Polaromonas sp. TaxID=1869339 RepID=UPI0025CBF854|nr:O-antigen ligase family protein [Polaromonas sp.]MBI2725160.1 O-antigen ligase family protein [Polaromonas sp.]
MAKKKRINSGRGVNADNGMSNPSIAISVPSEAAKPGASAASKAKAAAKSLISAVIPAEVVRNDWTVTILAFMMFLTPAIGVPNEEMLQDTLKSMVASFAAVAAGLLFFWQQRNRREGLRWHAVMWLPLALMVYALGSMVWSHTYLGGVEAIRWFIFSLILWLGLNTLSRERIPYLAEGIHWGAVVASLWAVLQFLFDFSYFPQGPNPASTFVNRNFFAEFVVCTMPFTVYLLFQARGTARIALLSFTLGFNIVALMMTGTRGALTAMWLLFGVVIPVIAVLYRKQFAFLKWDAGRRILASGILITTVVGLGIINTGNPKIAVDYSNAFDRAFRRTASISTGDYSLNIRLIMWKATGRIIEAKPLTGVGAGAWEAMLPLYQTEGSQLETDYYVHNEVLQLLAEYGLTGLIFLLALAGYLLYAAWRTLRNRTPEGFAEAPMRAIALASLMAFLIVSNIGFPWRLASTGCLFALGLALLAASDARLQIRGPVAATRLNWRPAYSQVLAVFMMAAMALTVYISVQSAAVEQKIVRAVKMSLGISQSGDFNNPKWDKTKKDILTLTKDAVAINTHYRKITPMVADEFAKWGDWKNAVWIWESVAISRPYVVAIMSNIARGYAQMGNNEKALEFLARCEKLQPKATSVRSLKVILMSRSGKEAEAAILAKQYLDEGTYDFDLINAAYVLSVRKGDFDTAIRSLEIRNKHWGNLKNDAFLKMGVIYAARKEDAKALAAFKAAVEETPDPNKDAMRKQIPPAYLARF